MNAVLDSADVVYGSFADHDGSRLVGREPGGSLSAGYTLQNGAAVGEPFGMDGCNRLRFEPSISVSPDGRKASTPTGLTVGVHVPQQAS